MDGVSIRELRNHGGEVVDRVAEASASPSRVTAAQSPS